MNPKTHYVLGFVLAVACWISACVTDATYGDRAYDEGHYNEALDYYEAAIQAGSQDPQLFDRAAKASIAVGSFSAAERYYSQALRYGAGVETARELGLFYLKTSNYASAVRVYQYLLREEKGDKRAIYNDLGTALMYAGRPFDAESYLMIAQQLDPKAPVSYLNLGLLYDRHLHQPWLAINFYECFVELGRQNKFNTKQAEQRIRELTKEWQDLYEEGSVACGEAYAPTPSKPVADLSKAMKTDDKRSEPEKAIVIGNPESPVTGVVVERMVEGDVPPVGEPTTNEIVTATEEKAIKTARTAFDKRDYARAEASYALVPVANLSREDKRDLGMSLLELNRPKEATSWLELSINEGEDPDTVEALIDAYRSSNQKDRVHGVCVKFRSRPDYENATRSCPPDDQLKANP